MEESCKSIDRAALRYEAAVNGLESVIYTTRDGLEYGQLKNYVTADEAKAIHVILDDA